MHGATDPVPVPVERQPFRAIFLPFPVACFTLTLFSDILYWRTANLMWHNFSAWLLFAGLIFGGLALIAGLVDLFVGRLHAAAAWPFAIGGILVLALAFVNSLLHAGDGWTAIVPYGLALSALTVVLMALTDWFCRARVYRYRYAYDRGVVR